MIRPTVWVVSPFRLKERGDTMLRRLADNSRVDSLATRLRDRRFQLLDPLLRLYGESATVLDVGGTPAFWRSALANRDWKLRLTILNLSSFEESGGLPMESIVGDARDMSQFSDQAYDICFSNSVIEHVGGWADQQAMAQEVARVGISYFVQTPNRSFPLEPHFLVPGWQLMPMALKKAMHTHYNLGWMQAEPDSRQAEADIAQIRLLSAKEMTRLFPDGTVTKERIGPFTKSFIAIRR